MRPPPGEKEARGVERIDDPREADARVLEHLASLGCDPAEPREVRHFFYAKDRGDAETVADTLAREGWATRVDEWDEAWLVVATHLHALTSVLVDHTRTQFELLAAEHDAHYDGWEADRAPG
jgi:regulator of RNase E activity RraB